MMIYQLDELSRQLAQGPGQKNYKLKVFVILKFLRFSLTKVNEFGSILLL